MKVNPVAETNKRENIPFYYKDFIKVNFPIPYAEQRSEENVMWEVYLPKTALDVINASDSSDTHRWPLYAIT